MIAEQRTGLTGQLPHHTILLVLEMSGCLRQHGISIPPALPNVTDHLIQRV